MKTTLATVEIRTLTRSGLWGLLFTFGFAAVYAYSMYLLHTGDPALIEYGVPLIVRSTLWGSLYGGVLIFPALLISVANALNIARKGYRERRDTRLQKLAATLVFVSLFAMIGGRPIANHQWAKNLRQAGYIECSDAWAYTGKIFGWVWTRDARICDDREIPRLLRLHGAQDPAVLERINQVLREPPT